MMRCFKIEEDICSKMTSERPRCTEQQTVTESYGGNTRPRDATDASPHQSVFRASLPLCAVVTAFLPYCHLSICQLTKAPGKHLFCCQI